MALTQKIEQTLKQVIDPETSMDVMRMRLVKNLAVSNDGTVSLTFSPSSPMCPLAFQLALNIQDAIKNIAEVTEVKIKVANYNRANELEKILAENQ